MPQHQRHPTSAAKTPRDATGPQRQQRLGLAPAAQEKRRTGEQPDQQREGARDLEPDQRLEPDPAEGLEVTGLRDADDDHAEHQRRDDRLDQSGKPVAERLEFRGEAGPQLADGDAEHKRAGDLREERGTQYACDASRQGRDGRRHGHSLGTSGGAQKPGQDFCDTESGFRGDHFGRAVDRAENRRVAAV